MKRALFLVGAAVGFVLGARAGHARYEQIKAAATRLATSPAARTTGDLAQQQLDTAVDAFHRLSSKVTETTRELPARIVHTTESLKRELGEATERNRQRQASTFLNAGDLRDDALHDLSHHEDDAMFDEHGADERNLSE